MSITWLAIFCACSSDYEATICDLFSSVLKKVPCQSVVKIAWIFLISSFENLASGANKARLKFRAEGGNVVVLLNRKLLVEIMQGKFSNDFSKTWGKKKKKKLYFIIHVWEGIFVWDVLFASMMRWEHTHWVKLGTEWKEISPVRHSLSMGVGTRYVQHTQAMHTC